VPTVLLCQGLNPAVLYIGLVVSKTQLYLVLWYIILKYQVSCIIIHFILVSCIFFCQTDTRYYYYRHLYWIIVPTKFNLICRTLKTQINVTIVVIFFVGLFLIPILLYTILSLIVFLQKIVQVQLIRKELYLMKTFTIQCYKL